MGLGIAVAGSVPAATQTQHELDTRNSHWHRLGRFQQPQGQRLQVLDNGGEVELVSGARQTSEPRPLEAVMCLQMRKSHLDAEVAVRGSSQRGTLARMLARTVVGTVGSLVAFRIGGDDADALHADLKNTELLFDQSKLAFANVAEPINLTDTQNYHAWVKLLDRGAPTSTRLSRMLWPEASITGRLEAIKNRSRARYLRPRAMVEDKINRFLARSPKPPRKKRAKQDRMRMTITWPIKGS